MWYRCHYTLFYFVLGSNDVAFLMKNNLQLFSDKQIRACEENKVLSICQDMAYQITKPFYSIKITCRIYHDIRYCKIKQEQRIVKSMKRVQF